MSGGPPRQVQGEEIFRCPMRETMAKFPFGETETLFENMKIMKMKIPQDYTPENEHSP